MLKNSTLFAIVLIAAGCSGDRLVSPPALFLRPGQPDPFAAVPADLQGPRVQVIYGTDRLKEGEGPDIYSIERSESLAFGICEVDIGKDLEWAAIRDASLGKAPHAVPLKLAGFRPEGVFPPTPMNLVRQGDRLVDDPKDVADRDAAHAKLQALVSSQLARVGRKEMVLFVHGVDTRLGETALTAAQFWHYFGRDCVTAVYSWPAGNPGALRGYTADREAGEFTIYHLKQFLRAVGSVPELAKLHVVTHSRGTDIFTTALRELHIENGSDPMRTRAALKLGNVVLAAPDLDLEVAQQRIGAERAHLAPERFTIYSSDTDKALSISNWLFEGVVRLGSLGLAGFNRESDEKKAKLATLTNFDLIAVQVKADSFGHSYFYLSPAVTSDLVLLLRDGRKPGAENGRPLKPIAKNYWLLDESYPNFDAPK